MTIEQEILQAMLMGDLDRVQQLLDGMLPNELTDFLDSIEALDERITTTLLAKKNEGERGYEWCAVGRR
ncbi:MAG: hypothetical protein ABW250_27710 [Pyrinomonadaceae bacterium]